MLQMCAPLVICSCRSFGYGRSASFTFCRIHSNSTTALRNRLSRVQTLEWTLDLSRIWRTQAILAVIWELSTSTIAGAVMKFHSLHRDSRYNSLHIKQMYDYVVAMTMVFFKDQDRSF
ncbi:hypothetical protein GOP47_0005096 [Adiantum capillus-veneris]|uniref:Uncharacterized protein n=1 Tax=Adiantum capillus-veneris TaxID=13818 RepID=A0A9D4V646_ADICA|nr:hypothetical protein GOP47_0005096 [Adiantum capillus-veneris]